MTEKEFFIETLKKELPAFERVLKAVEAVPKTKHSYKHDKKSRTTWELVESTFGSESGMFPFFLTTGKIDFATYPKPAWKTIEEIRKAFMKNMKETIKIVESMNTKQWNSKSAMYMNGKTEKAWESTKGMMAWDFLLDLIHHRGQLSTHLRPMGGKVPSIYGPSADTQ
ncbi:MAG TPA: DinB family protein [Chlamydiales bacterium]|nr:DinB family protein [Chlamydiales bacterium]